MAFGDSLDYDEFRLLAELNTAEPVGAGTNDFKTISRRYYMRPQVKSMTKHV